jgi:hypothetical protein
MVNILTPNQRSALNRALKHPELLPRLYRKVEGLHWSDAFTEVGLLESECNPPPKPAKDEGFFQIPAWPITEYLVKTSPLLKEPDNREYAIKFRNLLRNVTKHSKKEGFGNYRTWWQFAKVIRNIPVELLEDEDIELVRYWITDKFERGIIGETLGKWLFDLLEINNAQAKNISLKLLDALYEITFVTEKIISKDKPKAVVAFNSYRIDKLTERISRKASASLGVQAVDLFKYKLEYILDCQDNDKWSSIWRPAIEEHSQNLRNDDADDIVLKAFRESVMGLFEYDSNIAEKYLIELFGSKFQTVIRVAIFVIDQMFPVLNNDTSSRAIDRIYFKSNYRHEVWNLLSNRFEQFSDHLKEKTLEIIDNLKVSDEGEDHSEERGAYQKSIWLSAIYDKDDRAKSLYDACLAITKTVPEHPDFSSYISTGWVGHKSPIELETLRSLEYPSLVLTLNDYKGGHGFREPGIDGLTRAFKELVKLDAFKLYKELDGFISLHVPYVHSLIDAFVDLWEKGKETDLPWDSIWPKLLDYVHKVVSKDDFWKWPENREDGAFVANHHWIVGTIGRLIEAGCKSDEHSFEMKNIELSKLILCVLFEKEEGENFNLDSDAVSISINSPRGRCLEALINLSLFTCRNHEKIGATHLEAWEQYQDIFDIELSKPSNDEYEFATLVANYLHNFMYLSEEWTTKNLANIFDQSDRQRWLCAMQGYSYVNRLDHRIYKYLKENGDLIKALDEENLKDRVDDRFVQFITLAYLNDIEDFNDPNCQISILLMRSKQNELSQVIWFLWTFRGNIDDQLRLKVYQLWPLLLNITDTRTEEGQKLASQMCHLSVFIDEIDEERKSWLMTIAPYAEVDYNSHDLLETISRLSANYPFDVRDIWLAMLSEYSYDYPEDAIREALSNFVKQGRRGVQAAKEIVDAYLKHGVERPVEWLNEILSADPIS